MVYLYIAITLFLVYYNINKGTGKFENMEE
nr:MAG TPA: hypothetical protein [Caudoviricetes sp.]